MWTVLPVPVGPTQRRAYLEAHSEAGGGQGVGSVGTGTQEPCGMSDESDVAAHQQYAQRKLCLCRHAWHHANSKSAIGRGVQTQLGPQGLQGWPTLCGRGLSSKFGRGCE